ncbi:MAG: GAF domain-containing sensor histidine kinase [Anaerolineae bacterium]|nr:GAF domain-containing sensor histidine kinase [Anaerolineae bacterium]
MNSKDYKQLEQKVVVLEQLISISRRLNSTLEMRRLLQQIVDSAHQLTHADGASILLMETEETLRFAATSGPGAHVLEIMEVPIKGSLAGWVVKNREMAIVEDAQSDSRLYNIKTIDATQSIIAVPMIFGDEVIGVLESVTMKARYSFTRQDMETLETLASIAAVAVENARLFEQSDWVSEVIHEIRTPLTAILSYAELLQRPDLNDAMRGKFADIIQQETERVNELATTFLDLARLESGRVQMAQDSLEIPKIVELSTNVIKPSAEGKSRHVTVEIPDVLPQTIGDAQRIHQVLLNLLSNAVKYSDPGDTITVKAYTENQQIVIEVTDTGPGIPAEQISKLFRKFSRLPGGESKATGTGLGLVVARQIVEAHQGQIGVRSEVGRGSTFYFTLPIIPSPIATDVPSSTLPQMPQPAS